MVGGEGTRSSSYSRWLSLKPLSGAVNNTGPEESDREHHDTDCDAEAGAIATSSASTGRRFWGREL